MSDHHQHQLDPEKEKKWKKGLKRMSKIVSKAWSFEGSTPFQTSHSHSSAIICLTNVGKKIDAKSYKYGRHGWEDFAKDIGGVYNRHLQR